MKTIVFKKGELIVRKIEKSDGPLILKWLNDPEILQFYEGRDRPQNIELVKQHFTYIDDDETRCIVEYDNLEIGYIQYYPLMKAEKSSISALSWKVVYLAWINLLEKLSTGIRGSASNSFNQQLNIYQMY